MCSQYGRGFRLCDSSRAPSSEAAAAPAGRKELEEAYRAVQNCLLVVPDGKFKRDMDDWLTAKLGLGGEAAAAPVASAADERIDELLDELDTVARDHDSYEFGLPVLRSDDEDAPIHKLRAKVREWLAAAPSAERAAAPMPSEREAFEAWYSEYLGKRVSPARIEAAQAAWQARAALSPAAPKESPKTP